MTTRREIITSGLGLAGIIAAGRAPAAFVRSMVAARSAAFAQSGGSAPIEEWIDGCYIWHERIVKKDGCSYLNNYISVIPGHNVTVMYNVAQYNSYDYVEYRDDMSYFDYWGIGAGRTRSISSSAHWIRISVDTDKKQSIIVRDNTDGIYLLKDGRLSR